MRVATTSNVRFPPIADIADNSSPPTIAVENVVLGADAINSSPL